MKTHYLFLTIFLFSFTHGSSQVDTLYLTLNETVARAQGQAPDAEIARTAFSNNYWRYRFAMADYKPLVSLNATLPFLDRSIDELTLPSGELAFVSSSYMSNSVNLGVEQQLAFTGGSIFARTGLRRIDIFGADNRNISYLSTPFYVGFNQPLFQFNNLKWDRGLFPLRYQEAGRRLSEEMEAVSQEAATLFFQVLIAQLNLEAAQRNKSNADTLFTISEGRFSVGRIAETELLQVELNARNAEGNLARNRLELATASERLRDFLGITEAVAFRLTAPEETLNILIEPERALALARQNRSFALNIQRRRMEAEMEVARANANSGPNLDLQLTFGLSQTGPTVADAYQDLLDQEGLRLSVFVPIADYGKAKAEREIARSNADLVNLQLRQEEVNFEREIILRSQQFKLQKQQVALAKRAFDIARRRLDIVRERYRIGNILITDLNLAINEEASARTAYINDLRAYWLAYYELRQLTLHDFGTDQTLLIDAESGVRK